MSRDLRRYAALVAALLAFAVPGSALAAEPWVDRPLTLPRLVFAGDVGIGIAHVRVQREDTTGAGLNLEAGLGITDAIEIGLRTGLRFGHDGRALAADTYGRTLFTETYGTGHDSVANPEFRLRWAAYSGRVVEVGLDGRVYLPIEDAPELCLGCRSHLGIMMGVPLAFHVGGVLRIDTGLYIPVIFNPNTSTVISVPGDFWFQVTRKVWLGPMIGLRHVDPGGPPRSRDDLLLGFGVGWQVASSVDLKWMFMMPRVNVDNDEPRPFGVGFGVQFRIGE